MVHITAAQLDAQEARFAQAFAAHDIECARDLYHPAVVYLSPTVRLFDWPQRIIGVDKTLAFITLTIRGCRDIAYRPAELACLGDGASAFVRVQFDWDAGERRLRSSYVVLYRYVHGLIRQQELYYDPSGPLEEIERRTL